MIVSTAIAVLPVARSPMMSSRWPLPNGIIASMTRSPVASGRVTKDRSTMAGAGCSTGANVVVFTGAPPSSGAPSASTTRPSSASPTGTRATSPVPCTMLPEEIALRAVKEYATDCILAKIDGKAQSAAFKNEQLVETGFRQPPDSGHAVTNLHHMPDLLQPRLNRQARDALPAMIEPLMQFLSERCHEPRSPSARMRVRSARRGAERRPGNAVPPQR